MELVIDQLWLKFRADAIAAIIAFKFATLANQRASLPSLNSAVSSLDWYKIDKNKLINLIQWV